MEDTASNQPQTGSQADGEEGRPGEDNQQTSLRRGAAVNHDSVAVRVAASTDTPAVIVNRRQQQIGQLISDIDRVLPAFLRGPPANVNQNSKMDQELDKLFREGRNN